MAECVRIGACICALNPLRRCVYMIAPALMVGESDGDDMHMRVPVRVRARATLHVHMPVHVCVYVCV